VELQRSCWVRKTWGIDLWWRVSPVTLSPVPLSPMRSGSRGGQRGRGGGGEKPLRSRGHLHLQSPVLSVNMLLVKPMWLLSKLHIHRPKRNKKLLRVKMKVLWQYLPLLVSTANRELPSFRLKLHIFFSSFLLPKLAAS